MIVLLQHLRSLVVGLGGLLLAGSAAAQGLADPREVPAAMERAVDSGDLAAIGALHAAGAILLLPDRPAAGGREAIVQLYAQNFAAGANQLTFHGVQLDGGGDHAVVLWAWTLEITPPAGATIVRHGRSMLYLKNGPEGWQIFADMAQSAPPPQ